MNTKKAISFILFLLVCLSLGYLYFQSNNLPQTQPNNRLTSHQEESTEEVKDTQGFVFNEIRKENSQFPKASLDADISLTELKIAMDDYYQTKYSEEEKRLAKQNIPSKDLESLQKSFEENDSLKKLKATVEPVEIEIAGENLKVARIIIPFTYKEAKRIKDNNDILILNEALAQLGNHLIMVAYYNEKDQILTPMHLTNSLNPLFYNEAIE